MLEFQGIRATSFIMGVGWVKVPENYCAGAWSFTYSKVDREL